MLCPACNTLMEEKFQLNKYTKVAKDQGVKYIRLVCPHCTLIVHTFR
jgi:phage FluMu protein Com